MNYLDENFEQLMKTQKREKPSSRFSLDVMERIYQVNQVFVYKPLIGRWVWGVIFIVVGILFGYIIWSGNPSTSSGNLGLLKKIVSLFPGHKPEFTGIPTTSVWCGITNFFDKIPVVLLLAIIALSLLLLFDQFFSKKKKGTF